MLTALSTASAWITGSSAPGWTDAVPTARVNLESLPRSWDRKTLGQTIGTEGGEDKTVRTEEEDQKSAGTEAPGQEDAARGFFGGATCRPGRRVDRKSNQLANAAKVHTEVSPEPLNPGAAMRVRERSSPGQST